MPFRSFNTLIIRECFHYHAFYFIISGNVFQGSYADDMYKKKKKEKSLYLLWFVMDSYRSISFGWPSNDKKQSSYLIGTDSVSQLTIH